jgi:hypothetical protein
MAAAGVHRPAFANLYVPSSRPTFLPSCVHVCVCTPFFAIDTPSVPRAPFVLPVPFDPPLPALRPQFFRRCHPLHNEPTDPLFLPPPSYHFRSSCHYSHIGLTRKGRVEQGM